MHLKQVLASAVERLEAADVGSPRLNAEVLLMFVLSVHRAYLYAHPERELTPEEASRYDEVLAQRSTGMPSQYITGHQEFWGLDFAVTPAVLIPRPETEHLVETVLELARNMPHAKIVDVGTGSGCVALALAHELKDADVYATDVSPDALEVARANAARLQLASRVRFVQANVLTVIPAKSPNQRDGIPVEDPDQRDVMRTENPDQRVGIPTEVPKQRGVIPTEGFSPSGGTPIESEDLFRDFDFVVSNPPYVGFDEADKVQKSVRDFEPSVAVFAGQRGLGVIGPLVEQAHQVLKPGGWLAMEIGYSMRDAVVNLLNPTLWDDATVVPDLQGIPRVIAARRR